MKKLNILLCFLVYLLISQKTSAQTCATLAPATPLAYDVPAQQSAIMPSCYTVKLYFHFVRNTDGSGGLDAQTTIDQILVNLNNDFNPVNISFESAGDQYIDDSDFMNNYANPGNNSDYTTNKLDDIYHVSNAINIYMLEHITWYNPESQILYMIGITGISIDYIPSTSLAVAYTHILSSTMSHEIGHGLNLYHTHGFFPSPGNCNELIDGSNCETCGDLVCDTPADPMLNCLSNPTVSYPDCEYTGGGGYNPDAENIMSYSCTDCRIHFTDGQGVRMFDGIQNYTLLQDIIVIEDYDLAMKDRPEDTYEEPGYIWGWYYDNSPDIWVRNSNDGFVNQVHENPLYDPSNTPYVYVRIKNANSCIESTGNEILNLYWTKASTSSSWPNNWDGFDPDLGNLIGSQTINILQGDEETILEFPWDNSNMPDFEGTNINACLLARITNSSVDPINEYPGELHWEVFYNNNIAMKNLTIYQFTFIGPVGAAAEIILRNSDNAEVITRIDFDLDPILLNEAEVSVKLTPELYDMWINSGANGIDIKNHRTDPYSITLTSINAEISGIPLPANSSYTLEPYINFLTQYVEESQYLFHIAQYNEGSNLLLGAEHFQVNRSDREYFEATSSSSQMVMPGASVNLMAEEINEDATYNWYDMEGNLVCTGTEFTLYPEVSEEYELEVIATQDGYKDYSTTSVIVVSGDIQSISPNPANVSTVIQYSLSENATSAHLMITNSSSQLVNNHILNNLVTEISINTSEFNTGNYQVSLIVDGQISDSKILIVE